MTPDGENTKIALISKDIGYIQKDISEIKGSVKELAGVYAKREDLIEVAKQTELRFIRLEEQKRFWAFAYPTIAAVLASVMTFFIIQYFVNLGE